MEFTGRIIVVLEPKGGTTQKGEWKKQGFVIQETQGEYPKKMAFDLWNDDIAKHNLQVNTEVTISFDINAREYQSRWYNDIKVWKVEKHNAPTPEPTPQTQAPQPTPEQQNALNMAQNAFEEAVEPNNPKLPF